MKRLLAFALCLGLLIGCTGCGDQAVPEPSGATVPPSEESTSPSTPSSEETATPATAEPVTSTEPSDPTLPPQDVVFSSEKLTMEVELGDGDTLELLDCLGSRCLFSITSREVVDEEKTIISRYASRIFIYNMDTQEIETSWEPMEKLLENDSANFGGLHVDLGRWAPEEKPLGYCSGGVLTGPDTAVCRFNRDTMQQFGGGSDLLLSLGQEQTVIWQAGDESPLIESLTRLGEDSYMAVLWNEGGTAFYTGGILGQPLFFQGSERIEDWPIPEEYVRSWQVLDGQILWQVQGDAQTDEPYFLVTDSAGECYRCALPAQYDGFDDCCLTPWGVLVTLTVSSKSHGCLLLTPDGSTLTWQFPNPYLPIGSLCANGTAVLGKDGNGNLCGLTWRGGWVVLEDVVQGEFPSSKYNGNRHNGYRLYACDDTHFLLYSSPNALYRITTAAEG